MTLQQYADFELYPVALVKDRAGNLYTGPAKLYVVAPGADPLHVTPISLTVTAGVWPAQQLTGSTYGIWTAQIRAEGETKGSSPVVKFRVEPSPFPAPEATP